MDCAQVVNFFLIFALAVFIFALLGMETFRGRYSETILNSHGDEVPSVPYHFDNFYAAIVTIFVIISGENWNEVCNACATLLAGAMRRRDETLTQALCILGSRKLLYPFGFRHDELPGRRPTSHCRACHSSHEHLRRAASASFIAADLASSASSNCWCSVHNVSWCLRFASTRSSALFS